MTNVDLKLTSIDLVMRDCQEMGGGITFSVSSQLCTYISGNKVK